MSKKKITAWFNNQMMGRNRTPNHLRFVTEKTKYGEIREESNLFRRKKAAKRMAKLNSVLNMPVNGVLPVFGKAKGTFHYVGVPKHA